jgi:zinc-ribbon domain
VIRCPNCGEQNDPGSRFCFNCGADLSAAQPAAAPQPPPAPPFPPPAGAQPPAGPEEPRERYPPPPVPDYPPPPRPDVAPPARPGASIPPQYQPPPGRGAPSGQGPAWGGQPGQPSGWAALDALDPAPPPKRRATWLMVLLGIVLGCLLVCVGTFAYSLTPPGQDAFQEVSTVAAEYLTEAAPEPTRSP